MCAVDAQKRLSIKVLVYAFARQRPPRVDTYVQELVCILFLRTEESRKQETPKPVVHRLFTKQRDVQQLISYAYTQFPLSPFRFGSGVFPRVRGCCVSVLSFFCAHEVRTAFNFLSVPMRFCL